MGNKVKLYIRLLVIAALVAYLIIFFPGFYPLPQITAQVISFLLNLINIQTTADGTFLLVAFPGISRILELSGECSGIILFSIFILIIFIVPDLPMKHRVVAVLFLPILFIANVLRIMLGIVIGYYTSVDSLIFFHNTIGQVLMFLIAIVVYMIWLHLFGNFPREKSYKSDLDF